MNAPLGMQRRADIDHLRVGALLLLIVYHVLLVYSGDGWWRVSSEHAGYWSDYVTSLFTPWRMPLVFLIGGVAAHFMFDQMRAAAFVQDRATKLLTAFVFAVIVLTPFQRFVRLDEAGQSTQDGYLSFLLHNAPFAIEYNGLMLPDFAHAWFLPYLFVYSVLALLVWRAAPRTTAAALRLVERTPLWILITCAMAWLAVVETLIIPRWPMSGYLWPDLGAHAKFLPVFMFGVLVAKSEPFRQTLTQHVGRLWMAAVLLLAVKLFLKWSFLAQGLMFTGSPLEWYTARGLFAGVMLFAVPAFAASFLNRSSALLVYATDAILPVYLMHQTVLIVLADVVVTKGLPLALELPLLLGATLLIPVAVYHVLVRRTRWLRVLFGLRPEARKGGRRRTPAPDAPPLLS